VPSHLRSLLRFLRSRFAERRAKNAEWRQHEARIERAVERVVDQVDPRLRAVGGYRKRLLPAVERCLAHAEALAARLPGPVLVTRAAWAEDPYVNALFGSTERIRWVLSGPEVRAYVQAHPLGEDCFAALAARPEVRNQLGMELAGDQVQREVRQVTVSFADHEVGLVEESTEAVRARVAEVALDILVSIAVQDITRRDARIGELEERLRVVRIKRRVAETDARGAAFVLEGSAAGVQGVRDWEARIAELERELAEARKGYAGLDERLARLTELLDHPESHLTFDEVEVRLDRMNVVRPQGGDSTSNAITFARARRGDTPGRVLTLVRFPRSEILSDQERLKGVESYLG
jgi:hypothetical protein